MKKVAFLVLFIVFTFFIPNLTLALSCSIATSCSDVTVFKISGTTNAHAELPSGTNYGYYVCCSGTNIGNSCSGNYDTVLKLSSSTNAHVEEKTYSNYGNSVCLSASSGSVSCQYCDPSNGCNSCTDLGSNFVCLASISSQTNAHVGDCNSYSIKVCCAADTVPPNVSISHSPTGTCKPGTTQTVTFTASASDLSSGLSEIKIYVDNNLVKMCNYSGQKTGTCVYSHTGYPAGNHSYYAIAKDVAGNIATSSTKSFYVYPCGYSCTNATGSPGVCNGAGDCYTKAGAQTNCQGVLNCTPPLSLPPGYTRNLTGTCNRSGIHKRSDTGVCDLTFCIQTSSFIDPIQGSWSSIEYPGQDAAHCSGVWYDGECTYRIGDTIKINISGVTATSGFTPLLECKLSKKNETGDVIGGIYFDKWVSSFQTDVIFNYTVKSTDPSGNWSIDYCRLLTDFTDNYGWTLKEDTIPREFCVSTTLRG